MAFGKAQWKWIVDWFDKNFTWKGLVALVFWLLINIPDWIGRKDFWKANVNTFWSYIIAHSSVALLLLCALVIWIDHRAVLRKSSTAPRIPMPPGTPPADSLRERVFRLCHELSDYLENREDRPNETEIWERHKNNQHMFAVEWEKQVGSWDRKLSAGYWLSFRDRSIDLDNELELVGLHDENLDQALKELDQKPTGTYTGLIRKVVERFRYLASTLP